MKRIIIATLPVALSLLASCSWMYPQQKSGLGMAVQAANIAGADAIAARTDPIELDPAKARSSGQSAAVVTGTKPLVIVPSAKAVTFPAITPAIAPQESVATIPVATVPADAPVKQAAVMPTPQAPAADAANPGSGAVMAIAQPLAAGPVAVPQAASVDIDSTVPANGTAIHLASYREIGSAQRGWQILSKNYKELVPLKPIYVAVDLPGKGHVLRLYGTGADAAALKTICSEMHAQGAYCAANIAF